MSRPEPEQTRPMKTKCGVMSLLVWHTLFQPSFWNKSFSGFLVSKKNHNFSFPKLFGSKVKDQGNSNQQQYIIFGIFNLFLFIFIFCGFIGFCFWEENFVTSADLIRSPWTKPWISDFHKANTDSSTYAIDVSGDKAIEGDKADQEQI